MEAKSKKIVNLVKSYNAVIILLLLVIVTSFVVDGMTGNFDRVLTEGSQYSMFAIGLALVMVTGNIDLSVGFQAATASVIVIKIFNLTGNLAVAVVAALAAGAVMGFINGFAVVQLKISPLIATIATNYIYKGIVYYFTRSGALRPEAEDGRAVLQGSISRNYLFDSNWLCLTVIIMVVVLIGLYFVMRKTRFGVGLYIAGDNAEAGLFAGMNMKRVSWAAYVLCGVFCALAGVFLCSKSGSAIYSQGEGRDVFAISACVIGGIKMAGGKGTMVNVLLGVLVMRVISTAMDMMLIPAAWVDFVSGVLLILILIIDRFTAVKKDV